MTIGIREPRAARTSTTPTTAIAVAIVSYNTRHHLDECLASLEADGATEVTVVDNGSTDGSIELVRERYPWVTLQVNATNRGYGAAANQAIACCRSEYVLILNSDTQLFPGTLQRLSRYLEHHPRCGIVGPRLLNPDGSVQRSCFPFPTPLNVLIRETSLRRLLKHLPYVSSRSLHVWKHTEARIVPWVVGAAIAIRRDAFLDVCGFDESYFMYSEDVDLAFRLRAAGWETHYCPDAEVMHIGSASSSQYREVMDIQTHVSRKHFYQLNYSRMQLALLYVITSYILLRNMVRDTLWRRLRPTRSQSVTTASESGAWKRLLAIQRKAEP